jgi:hypothetical protein
MKQNEPLDDPVEELHRVREQLWREAGESWERYFAGVRQREAENKDQRRVIPVPPKPDGERTSGVA